MFIIRTVVLCVCLAALGAGTACNVKDSPPSNSTNNATNNGTNNGTNDATNNGTNNGTNNATNSGTNNGTNNGPLIELPSSAAVTGGTLEGESENYKVRMQVGAPHAQPKPSSEDHKVEVAPPAPR